MNSKDIDIELYGISSFAQLEKILKEFGSVNSVGKSFGVCKLEFASLDLDFSFPRQDSKVSKGHKGFEVEISPNLDFKTASSRRDFTINSMGYDVKNKTLLDPFDGEKDLKNKILRAVDSDKFQQDPLRVFRAVQFSARFDFDIDKKLFDTCHDMVKNRLIDELPKERIFEELKKLLLKAEKISKGILLLQELGIFKEFHISDENLATLDRAVMLKFTNERQKLVVILALYSHEFLLKKAKTFLNTFTDETALINSILKLIKNKNTIDLDNFTDFDLYMLSREVKIEEFVLLLKAIKKSDTDLSSIKRVEKRAKKLNILNHEAPVLIKGKDLIALGLKPSKEFSSILEKAYIAQLKDVFKTHEDGVNYLKKLLSTYF